MKTSSLACLGVLLTLLTSSLQAPRRHRRPAGSHRPSLVSGRTGLLHVRAAVRHSGEVYQRVLGSPPKTDQEKALAAWLWRNTHFWHGEEGTMDLWGQGFEKGADLRLA